MIDAMIFSKNRPMQLHALLSSMKRITNMDMKKVTVLHKYDKKYEEGLNKVKIIHKDVVFLEEDNFENQVKTYLKLGEKYCMFFVDDMLFKEETNFSLPCAVLESSPDILTFSLRLGLHLNYCYPVNSEQPIPNGEINHQIFFWNWKNSGLDWNYPFSLDGNIFRRRDLEGWSSHLSFSNPNQLEDRLQSIKSTYAIPEICSCQIRSRTFNMPLNRVQEEYKNRAENVEADELYSLWMSGKELDYEKVFGFINSGAHHPLNLPLKDSV